MLYAYYSLALGLLELGTLLAHGAEGRNPQVKVCRLMKIFIKVCLRIFLFGSNHLPPPSHTPVPFTCFSPNSGLLFIHSFHRQSNRIIRTFCMYPSVALFPSFFPSLFACHTYPHLHSPALIPPPRHHGVLICWFRLMLYVEGSKNAKVCPLCMHLVRVKASTDIYWGA